MKRGREEDLFLYRSNDKQWVSSFEAWSKYFNNSQWETRISFFKSAWDQTRFFVGWISGNDFAFRERWLKPSECFIDLDESDCYGVRTCKTSKFFYSIEACIEYIRDNKLNPLDRGKTLYFAPAAARLARVAIDAWTLCALRLGLVSDVRKLISERYLWPDKHLWIP